jgi:hypothetical protein
LKLGGSSTGNVQANALQNTNAAQNSTKKEVREKLKGAVEAFKVDLAKRIKDLAAELDLEEKVVEKELKSASKFKSKKAYSRWDAQVWAKGLEVNKGKHTQYSYRKSLTKKYREEGGRASSTGSTAGPCPGRQREESAYQGGAGSIDERLHGLSRGEGQGDGPHQQIGGSRCDLDCGISLQ